MRGLLERVNLTSPGRAKVYLLDEVHMLTAGAENALLKTLEEPPAHVTWVLATTEPHKVVQTIRSRCQVFELGLIGADIMTDHVRYVVADAELDLDDEAIDHAVAAGGGSVRDTLTALEQIVTAGGTAQLDSSTDAILSALADHDRAAALSAVGDAVGRGRDPRTIGEMALAGLRDAFLTAMGDAPTRMSEHERTRAADLAGRMAPAAITRALETLGRALIDMRQAPDPRVDIEVALMRLCHPDEDRSLEALAQRLRQLEARLDGSPVAPVVASMPPPPAPAPAHPPAHPAPAHPAPEPATAAELAPASAHPTPRPATVAEPAPPPAPVSTGRPAEAARRALSHHRSAAAARRDAATAAAPSPPASDRAAPPPPVPMPDPAAMHPKTPTEVVEWARRHLGLDRDFVVARAVDLQPDKERRRDPDQLQALWKDLVAHASEARPEADPTGPEADPTGPEADATGPEADPTGPTPSASVASEGATETSPAASVAVASSPSGPPQPADAEELHTPPEEKEIVDGFDLSDLHELAEAPSHAHDIEQKIKATFPGAELTLLPDPEGDGDGGEA